MKKEKLCCVKCGRDITRAMKIYPRGFAGGAYCYDCGEAEDARLKSEWPKKRKARRKRERNIEY